MGRRGEPGSPLRQAMLLEAVLHYLEAALSPQVPSAARILALACLLRADADGFARLPHGLLRALRLAHHSNHLAAILTEERWLRPAPGTPEQRSDPPGTGLAVRLNDPAASAALAGTGRRFRRALFDWVSALLTHHQVRALDCASRLAVLRLAVDPCGIADSTTASPTAGCARGAAAQGPTASTDPPDTQAMRGEWSFWPGQATDRTPAPPEASRSAPPGVMLSHS
jgi:hypothetical protein